MPSCRAPKRLSRASHASFGDCELPKTLLAESATLNEISINPEIALRSHASMDAISSAVGLSLSTGSGLLIVPSTMPHCRSASNTVRMFVFQCA